MSVTSFQENSLGWRIELAQQRFQEWWELQMSKLERNTPDLSLFDSELIRISIKIILWSLIAIILVWLTWQVWLLLRPMIKNWNRQRQQLKRSPFPNQIQTQLSPQDWLTKAQQYYQQQNYRQGIFCLYQGMLQQLSDRQRITILSSRTDGEYLKLIEQSNLEQFLSYKLLFSTHEQLCFSNFSASIYLFDKCQQAYHVITKQNS
ncbi:MAG: DUF4129 domain-containing protein [Xenococcaceae cyanobacterium MO_167.B27]|nr:DUF4129 domain-containing protein [Xenococcaceae cyanobacterium MO_167.B27]